MRPCPDSSVVIRFMATWAIVILMEPWCRVRTDRHFATLGNNSRRHLLHDT
uniref:Uncharacterized protein n=1 Tax=Arundo donax TaxID=35708 RepID=A0A0A9G326_ARUDO